VELKMTKARCDLPARELIAYSAFNGMNGVVEELAFYRVVKNLNEGILLSNHGTIKDQ
jgi:hypothetical protein